MKTIKDIEEYKKWLKGVRQEGLSIGLVPTMGYFHQGHLELMRRAKEECDLVVVSIFVNPLQFGVGEDYEEYPRDLSRDQNEANQVGVDVIFTPSVREMYSSTHSSFVEVTGLNDVMCGSSRPGHFRGVTTVVAKLFNILQPDRAYFGQKDAQQKLIIEKMVKDLNMPLEIVTVPIVREEDGLAMSSRNVYLSSEERKQAPVLYNSLKLAEGLVTGGEKSAQLIKDRITRELQQASLAEIDYVEVRDCDNLQKLEVLEGKVLIALAVRFGKTRLIDNVILEVK
ncbi:pantoate--beta-alanine ligase [Desulfitispora alkaliphila]|uniref:pantoate--beta-alanine ligase n=1 Tax=Desulfitispora alkaliphila TaxID=622674 RepID=UPI003D1BCEE8